MKIKKKDLRKGLAQLPINYPDPDVEPNALPGGVLDMDRELVQVELICKRLGHNEVVVRDAALADVPRYLERLTATLAEMEEEFADEIASVEAYFKAHPKSHNPYQYNNIPLALFQYRQRVHDEDQKLRRRQAVRQLKQEREERRQAKANYGRYGATPAAAAEGDGDEAGRKFKDDEEKVAAFNEHKDKYAEWMQTWCDAELIFLKLSRGLHFCLWHSDKPLVQLACAQRIADLISSPATVRSKVLFYGSLFRVLAREWPTIDRYRMDKYLALVRRMVLAWVGMVKGVAAEEDRANEKTVKGGAAAVESSPSSSKTPALAKKKAKGKRAREDEEAPAATAAAAHTDAREEDEEGGADASLMSAANNAKGVPELYINRYFDRSTHPVLSQILREIFYILQVQIVPSTTSVGLTMHVCDIAFDELTKANLSVPLYVTLAAGIPLYAMSQGNYVEKRVLDSFFPPLAGGVFTGRRAAQILAQLQKDQKKKGKNGAARALTPEELEHEAARLAAMDNNALLGEVAHCCQLFSVSRGTARAVRVMFSEAELVLQQARTPDAYQTLTRTAQRRRLEREIEEVNETRGRVRDERQKKREVKKEEHQDVIREKVKARKEAMLKAKKAKSSEEIDEKALKKEVLEEEKLSATKKAPRDTKRKKTYKLTKADLYGDNDSGDEDDPHAARRR